MSETVGYKGKLKLCKKYKDANELQSNLQKFWQSIPRENSIKMQKRLTTMNQSTTAILLSMEIVFIKLNQKISTHMTTLLKLLKFKMVFINS